MSQAPWWEEKRKEVFGQTEEAHFCCLTPETSREYTEWILDPTNNPENAKKQ